MVLTDGNAYLKKRRLKLTREKLYGEECFG